MSICPTTVSVLALPATLSAVFCGVPMLLRVDRLASCPLASLRTTPSSSDLLRNSATAFIRVTAPSSIETLSGLMDALLQLCRPAQALLAASASSPSAPPALSTQSFPRDPAGRRGATPSDYVSGRLAPGTKWQNEDKSARGNRSVRDARLSLRHTYIGLELCDYRLEEGDGVLRRVEEPHGNPPSVHPVCTESLDSTTKPATASPLGGKAATSRTRKGLRDSDSGSGWEKAAHDLAKQRDALRGGEARPPWKRMDGERFKSWFTFWLAPTCRVTCIVTVCALYILPDRRAFLYVQEAKSSVGKFPRLHTGRS